MPHARYKLLVDRIADDIRQGRLPPGTLLPTHRRLAAREGISLATATRTYAELQAMGLVAGEVGRGTFVREAIPRGLGVEMDLEGSEVIDLGFNAPALPAQAELLRTALRQLALTGDLAALLRYPPHGGRMHERAVVAAYLQARGVPTDAGRVVLVNGAIHGLAVIGMGLLQPGDVVAVDALSYPGMQVVAELCRLELVPFASTATGPDLQALDRLCRQRRVRAVYCMPTLHNPLGWVMPMAQRQALVALARHHGLLLLEDAAYAFLASRAPPPLAALAPDITVYVSSLSKSVGAGLRFGFVSAPSPHVPRLIRAIRGTAWSTPPMVSAICCGWLQDGTVQRLEQDKRADAAARQIRLTRALGSLPALRHRQSYFAWLPMPEEVRADAVAQRLKQENILVSTAAPYAVAGPAPQAIRLALASVSPVQLDHALARVVAVVRQLGG